MRSWSHGSVGKPGGSFELGGPSVAHGGVRRGCLSLLGWWWWPRNERSRRRAAAVVAEAVAAAARKRVAVRTVALARSRVSFMVCRLAEKRRAGGAKRCEVACR